MDLNQPLRAPESGIVSQEVEKEMIAIDLQSGAYYSLNASAALIWKALQAGRTPARVMDLFCARFPGAREKITETFPGFFSRLVREGLMTEAGTANPAPAGTEPAFEPQSEDAFQAPALEKFTDMQEFLLIDPIHEVNLKGWPHPKDANSEKP